MTQRALFLRLGNRVIEEGQLLAEQKWIVEALAKIKNQRNRLQIERLHLESMKGKLRRGNRTTITTELGKPVEEDINVPSTSAVNLMQSAPKSSDLVHVSGAGVTDDDIICNEQELDLMISDCLFNNHGDNLSCNMEEDEEEDDDVMIDMNMLMNGNSK